MTFNSTEVQLKDILNEVSRPEVIEREKPYNILGVRWYAKGLFTKDVKKGEDIKAKTIYKVEKGDFIYNRLFAWKGSFAIVTEQFNNCYVSNEFPCFKVDQERIDLHYLLWYFNQEIMWRQCLEKSEGSTAISRNRLKVGRFLSFKISLPPLSIQKEIVNKLNSSFTRIDEITSLKEDTKFIVGNLRLKILQDAMMGKLISQDHNNKSAFELLKDISKHKEHLINEGKIKKEKPLPIITKEEIPYDLPHGWTWSRLGDIAKFIDYRGKTPNKTTAGIPLITAKNVKFGYISEEPKEYVSESDYEKWMTRGIPEYNDVIFTTEAPLGNVAQLNIRDKYALAQRTITFNLYGEYQQSFLKYVLMSPIIREIIIKQATGTTAQGIKASKLKNIPIPVPPVNEQKLIVKKLNVLMSLLTELEKQISEYQNEIRTLQNSVFEAAFTKERVCI